MHIFPVFNISVVLLLNVLSFVPIGNASAADGNFGASLMLSGDNEITAMDVIMIVPPKPINNPSALWTWVGIQQHKGSKILRSTLSYNTNCGSTGDKAAISPEYAEATLNCGGSHVLLANTTQEIYIQFRKVNTVWNLYVTNKETLETSTLSVDVLNTPQKRALLGVHAPVDMKTTGDLIFKNWVIQASLPDPNLCGNLQLSRNTICSSPQVYEGNLQCALTNCVMKLT
ncbi:hypothetical protein K7432_008182 [Basidiobolus ranarum]|uniref:Uncharacterized protein n=1 Tax=Basidiobolus ranarum TaxID=34480 RepID=A0ABR2VZ18_9FUNG